MSVVKQRTDDRRNTSAETSESLCREAGRLLAACGIVKSRAWLSRTVRDYMHVARHLDFPFGPFLLNRIQLNQEQRLRAMHDPEVASFLCYADPTGEIAVARVLRSGRS